MSSSEYYWSRHLIQGFGKMWFLVIPQESDSSGGGESLLGSVVNEKSGGFLSGHGNIIGKDYPEPFHVTTRKLIFNAINSHRNELGIGNDEQIVVEVKYPNLTVTIDKEHSIKSGVGNFPSIPASFNIDYSRLETVSFQFGENTRRLFIPTGYLSRLKDSVGDDDKKIATDVNIDKEIIIHEILLTDQYSVSFQSTAEFDSKFESSIQVANAVNAGAITFDVNQTTKKQVTVNVNDGKEYLIALNGIDWDDF
jgi:hypothetical protein